MREGQKIKKEGEREREIAGKKGCGKEGEREEGEGGSAMEQKEESNEDKTHTKTSSVMTT